MAIDTSDYDCSCDEIEQLTEDRDEMVAMACEIIEGVLAAQGNLQSSGVIVTPRPTGIPQYALDWYTDHRQAEARAQDELRAELLSKMSPAELKALGLTK